MRRQRIDRGLTLLGGLIATLAMTVFLYLILPVLRRGPLQLPEVLGNALGVGWVAGLVLHFLLGTIALPLLFTVFYDVLPGRPWVRGMVWGSALWFVAELVVIPIGGGGFFHADSGGPGVALVFLLAHLLYGAALGAIARASVPGPQAKGVVRGPRPHHG